MSDIRICARSWCELLRTIKNYFIDNCAMLMIKKHEEY